jgi:hypothetical protein
VARIFGGKFPGELPYAYNHCENFKFRVPGSRFPVPRRYGPCEIYDFLYCSGKNDSGGVGWDGVGGENKKKKIKKLKGSSAAFTSFISSILGRDAAKIRIFRHKA